MTDNNSLLSDYYTEEELAAELDKSVETLRRWRRQRKGPPYTHNGREIIYRKTKVPIWLESNEVETQAA